MYYLLKWIKFSVKKTKQLENTGKWKKNTGKSQGILSVWKSGNHVLFYRLLCFDSAFLLMLNMDRERLVVFVERFFVNCSFALVDTNRHPFSV